MLSRLGYQVSVSTKKVENEIMEKRFLAILLTVALLVSSLSAAVMASDLEGAE